MKTCLLNSKSTLHPFILVGHVLQKQLHLAGSLPVCFTAQTDTCQPRLQPWPLEYHRQEIQLLLNNHPHNSSIRKERLPSFLSSSLSCITCYLVMGNHLHLALMPQLNQELQTTKWTLPKQALGARCHVQPALKMAVLWAITTKNHVREPALQIN